MITTGTFLDLKKPKPHPLNRGLPTLDQLSDFFTGDMEEQELASMFQPMINSGVVLHFPLDFIQMSVMLTRSGICKEAEK